MHGAVCRGRAQLRHMGWGWGLGLAHRCPAQSQLEATTGETTSDRVGCGSHPSIMWADYRVLSPAWPFILSPGNRPPGDKRMPPQCIVPGPLLG